MKKLIFERFLPKIIDLADIIDVGCAAGEWTSLVAKKCHHIDGYDYSDNMMKVAKKKWRDISKASFLRLMQELLSINKSMMAQCY